MYLLIESINHFQNNECYALKWSLNKLIFYILDKINEHTKIHK